jgi:UDPglucose--hexose-1-phosphate uridylyltransferase
LLLPYVWDIINKMVDFSFLKDSLGNWVILSPKRAKRPDQAQGSEPDCPFEIIDGKVGDLDPIFRLNEVSVIPNIYPFAPIHEVIIHSYDHRKNFGELDYSRAEDVFKVYRERAREHKNRGQVYIFLNSGKNAGESLPHPHTQLTVIPFDVELKLPVLRLLYDQDFKILDHFYIFCPHSSSWPDEIWVAPKKREGLFTDASSDEIKELSFIVSRLIQLYTLRYGFEIPYNFYIYPGNNWYLRLIPRVKTLGGFEVGTGVYINTQKPQETFKFIESNFDNPDFERIREIHQAQYDRAV